MLGDSGRMLVVGAGYLGGEVMDVFRAGGWEVFGASLSGGDGLLACDVSNLDRLRIFRRWSGGALRGFGSGWGRCVSAGVFTGVREFGRTLPRCSTGIYF